MRNDIVGGSLVLAVALAGCAHANATSNPGYTKKIVTMTTTWNCPAGTTPDKAKALPNCEAVIPTAQVPVAQAEPMEQTTGAEPMAQAQAQPREERVFEKRVEFSSGSAELTDASKETLDQIASAAKSDPSIEVIYIVGHTDNTGPADLNEQLSDDRAEAVKSYLEAHDVSVNLDKSALGEYAPVASNDSAEGRTINRSAAVIGVKPLPSAGG